MSSCHRPRIYRSVSGCCICGAKSSSSRFTSSGRYEQHFEQCFELHVGEQRAGDICNACVLLVKRFRSRPVGSTRCWAHVKDARTGPGLKSMSKMKSKKHISLSRTNKARSLICNNPMENSNDDSVSSDGLDDVVSAFNGASSLIDNTYWKRLKVCCGVIYRGLHGECLVDTAFFSRCADHVSSSRLTSSTASINEESLSSVDDVLETELCPVITDVTSSVDVVATLSPTKRRRSVNEV